MKLFYRIICKWNCRGAIIQFIIPFVNFLHLKKYSSREVTYKWAQIVSKFAFSLPVKNKVLLHSFNFI